MFTARELEDLPVLVNKGCNFCGVITSRRDWPGTSEQYKLRRERTYALSALGTGSPSLTNARNIDFLNAGFDGLVSGRSDTGGDPNVTQ